jgi:hypothetical protein
VTFPHTLPQDTPIRRACIADMSDDQIEALVAHMQQRRMAAYTAYQEAQQMKVEIKHAKDALQIEKRLEQIEKIVTTAERQLDKAMAYVAEIKVLRLTQ